MSKGSTRSPAATRFLGLPAARWPDLVIALRVALAFVVVALFSQPFPFAVIGAGLIAVVIAMDALDGWVARRLGVASDLGGVLDIAADRVVEHVFWIHFAVLGVIPLWVPLLIVTRSFAVDAVRTLALARGRTAFGERTLQRPGLSRFLVASRTMRNAYGVTKVAAFLLLGVVVALRASGAAAYGLSAFRDPAWVGRVWLEAGASVAVLAAVALCLLRGAPVLWDARRLLREAS